MPDSTNPPQYGVISPRAIAEALNKLIRKGANREEILRIQQDIQALLDLQSVRGSGDRHPIDIADSFIRVLENSCRRVEPKSRADAARALFGLYPGTEDKSVEQRERRAADLMGTTRTNLQRFLRSAIILSVAREIDHQEFHLIQLQQNDMDSLVYPEGYAIISSTTAYRISDTDYRSHLYTRTVKIMAVQPHVTQFANYYQWSGSGQEGPPELLSEGHQLIGKPVPVDNWKYYYVHLGRDLKVGESETVKLRQQFYDEKQSFRCFFGEGTRNEGIERITVRVELPLQRLPMSIEYCTYANVNPPTLQLPADDGYYDPVTGIIEWTPRDICYPRTYVIRWIYPNGSLYPENYGI